MAFRTRVERVEQLLAADSQATEPVRDLWAEIEQLEEWTLGYVTGLIDLDDIPADEPRTPRWCKRDLPSYRERVQSAARELVKEFPAMCAESPNLPDELREWLRQQVESRCVPICPDGKRSRFCGV